MLLDEHSIDAVGLCETKLDNKFRDSNVSIAGYRVFRNEQILNRAGAAMYVKDFPEHSIKVKSDTLEPLVLEPAPENSKSFL